MNASEANLLDILELFWFFVFEMDREDRRLMEDLDELLLDELVVELDDNERCRRLCLLEPEDEDDDDDVEYRRRCSLDRLRRTLRRLCKKMFEIIIIFSNFLQKSK